MPTWSQGIKQFVTGNNGAPLAGGSLTTYIAGTNTPKATYADSARLTPNSNPTILDARGEALMYWSGSYKVVAKDRRGRILWSVDGVNGTGLVLTTPDTLNVPPVANFTHSPASGTHPLTVTFTNSSLYLIGSESFLWDFGDGVQAASINAVHTYSDVGIYAPTLTVTNEFGASVSVQRTIVVAQVPAPQVVDITYMPSSGITTAMAVQFAVSHTGSATVYAWTFYLSGAQVGTVSSNPTPSFNFANPGEASVRVAISGPGGTDQRIEVIGTVTADAPAVTDIQHNASSSITPGSVISFSESHNGSAYAWAWVFKVDGVQDQTSVLTSPSYTANVLGLLRAEVTLTGPGGTSSTYGEDIGTVGATNRIIDHLGNRLVDHLGNFVAWS